MIRLPPPVVIKQAITKEMAADGVGTINKVLAETDAAYSFSGVWPTVYSVSIRNGFFPLIAAYSKNNKNNATAVSDAVELMRLVATNFTPCRYTFGEGAAVADVRPTPRTKLALLAVIAREIKNAYPNLDEMLREVSGSTRNLDKGLLCVAV